jgi:PAS domain S-box-containing protein
MGQRPTKSTSTSDNEFGQTEAFWLRTARALSGMRRETLFDDLALAASQLLGADIGLIGRYVELDGVPSISTLACTVDGEVVANEVYPLAGTPSATVTGHEFRFYPDGVSARFPSAVIKGKAIAGYAAFPLIDEDGARLGIFCVMSCNALNEPVHAEVLLRIYSETVVAQIQRSVAQDELKASEERYRSIFNAAVDGLALLSPEGIIIDVNAALEHLYGYDRSQMVGEHALHFTSGPSRANALRFLDVVRNEKYAAMVDTAKHRDGTEFYIEPRAVTVNYQGRTHILAVIRDVTERMNAEKQRVAVEAQLRQAQKMEAIGHLTGGVAHDFNNILTSVLGYVELARDHVESQHDDKLNHYLSRAHRSGRRARDLIQQMLTFSRGQQGDPRALLIGPIVEDIVSLLESMVPASVTIRTQIDSDLSPVVVDPVHIEHILVNLCLNARDSMPGGGSLTISLAETHCEHQLCASCHTDINGEFIEIAVADTGAGMAPKLLERIFEPFFSTKDTGKGSGMGLSTAHGMVHEYCGHIVVNSRPGEGTRVRVLLPKAPADTKITPDPVRDLTRVGVSPKFEGRVLLVDDNAEVAEFVSDLLSDWGFEVSVFNDAQAALDHFLAQHDRYRLAMLHHTMPTITGLNLAELMLQHRPELSIILYSGYGDLPDNNRAKELGIRAFLQKPLDVEYLGALIQQILNA